MRYELKSLEDCDKVPDHHLRDVLEDVISSLAKQGMWVKTEEFSNEAQ